MLIILPFQWSTILQESTVLIKVLASKSTTAKGLGGLVLGGTASLTETHWMGHHHDNTTSQLDCRCAFPAPIAVFLNGISAILS